MKVYIMSCKYYCIDETMIIVTKMKISIYVRAMSLLLLIYPMSISADFLFLIITNNDRMGLVPSPASCICRKSFMKKGQKQVKKKAFKINAKIEDVGLNEDLKQEMVTKF